MTLIKQNTSILFTRFCQEPPEREKAIHTRADISATKPQPHAEGPERHRVEGSPERSHHGQCWGELWGSPEARECTPSPSCMQKQVRIMVGTTAWIKHGSCLEGAWSCTSYGSFYYLVSPLHSLPRVLLPQWLWFCHPNSPFLVFIGHFLDHPPQQFPESPFLYLQDFSTSHTVISLLQPQIRVSLDSLDFLFDF